MWYSLIIWSIISAGYYMFKVKNRNARVRCEICSKLTIKTQEQGHWRVALFLLLTLSK